MHACGRSLIGVLLGLFGYFLGFIGTNCEEDEDEDPDPDAADVVDDDDDELIEVGVSDAVDGVLNWDDACRALNNGILISLLVAFGVGGRNENGDGGI